MNQPGCLGLQLSPPYHLKHDSDEWIDGKVQEYSPHGSLEGSVRSRSSPQGQALVENQFI